MNSDYPHYAVRIEFEDDEPYQATVAAQNSTRAFFLALQDSRMASAFGSFHSPVKAWTSTILEEETA